MGRASTDRELLEATRRGETAAFGRLVERYQSLVCAVSYSATGDRVLSEDVAQDTFLAAWRQVDKLREPKSLRAWLCGIARNLGRKARYKSSREAPVDEPGQLTAPDASPFESAATAESERIVWEALRRIPESSREALVLYYRENRSAREVARVLGISESAALQRLSRGRKQLSESVARIVESSLERSRPRRGFAAAVVAALPAPDALPHLAESALGTIARTTPSHGDSSMIKSITLYAGLSAAGVAGLVVYHYADSGAQTVQLASAAAPAEQVTIQPRRVMAPSPAPRLSVGSAGPESLAEVHEQDGVPVSCEGVPDCEGNVDCAVPAECDADEACGKPDTEPRVTAEQIAELGLYEGASRGPADAPVTIVVFGDFTCHLCGEVLGTIDELWDDYPGQLRLIVKPFVTKDAAWLAAQAAHAAGDQGKFWAMHDLMYANQDDLSLPALVGYAEQAGLDVDRFRAALDSGAFKDKVTADLALAEELGIVGTPSFLINGKLFAGVRPIDQFRASIDPELAKASRAQR